MRVASDFFNTIKLVTEEELKAPWGGDPKKFFRCGFCGHKFQLGDLFMLVYTNGMQGAGGNPMACGDCKTKHGGIEGLREEWRRKHVEWKEAREGKFWWFYQQARRP